MSTLTLSIANRIIDSALTKARALNAMTGGRVVPLAGGVLIRNGDGVIVGAVGVSGAKPEEDAVCARAGIDCCGL